MKIQPPTYPPEVMRVLTRLSDAVLELDGTGFEATVSIAVGRGLLVVAQIDHLGRVEFLSVPEEGVTV